MVMRGEVWWYEDETVPRRPVLVLSRSAVADRLTHVIGVPATTVVRDIPSEVQVGPDEGMPLECVLSTDNVGQFRAALLTDRVTTLDRAVLGRVVRGTGDRDPVRSCLDLGRRGSPAPQRADQGDDVALDVRLGRQVDGLHG